MAPTRSRSAKSDTGARWRQPPRPGGAGSEPENGNLSLSGLHKKGGDKRRVTRAPGAGVGKWQSVSWKIGAKGVLHRWGKMRVNDVGWPSFDKKFVLSTL